MSGPRNTAHSPTAVLQIIAAGPTVMSARLKQALRRHSRHEKDHLIAALVDGFAMDSSVATRSEIGGMMIDEVRTEAV